MTRSAIARRYPDEEKRRAEAGDHHYRPPGGESFADIEVRLASFLTDLNAAYAGRRVIVVAHDAVVLMMRAVIERLDWAGVVRVSTGNSVRNGSITRFDGRSGRLVLDRYNTVDHLPDDSAAPPDQAAPPDPAA